MHRTSGNVTGNSRAGRRGAEVLRYYSDNEDQCGLAAVRVEVISSDLRVEFLHSQLLKPAATKATNHTEQLHPSLYINPRRLALPPTRWLWQTHTVRWPPRTTTLPLQTASCSWLMFEALGFSVQSWDKLLWAVKTQITFLQLITDSVPLPRGHAVIVTQKPQPPLSGEIWLDGVPPPLSSSSQTCKDLTAVLI